MAEKETVVGSLLKTAEGDMAESIIGSILPKVKPFIKPMLAELNNYLGDEDKTIVIRKKKDKSGLVMIFDNTKSFNISGGEIKDDEGYTTSTKGGVTGDKDSCLKIFSVDDFVNLLLEGKLTDMISKM